MSTERAFRKFNINEKCEAETVQQFVERNRLISKEMAWPQTPPVRRNSSLRRLRAALANAGFTDIELWLSGNAEDVSFKVRITDRVVAHDGDELLRLWITALRQAGCRIGFEEVSIIDVEDTLLSGHALSGPIAEIAENGAPQIEKLSRAPVPRRSLTAPPGQGRFLV